MSETKSLQSRAGFSEAGPVIPQDHPFRFLNFFRAKQQLPYALGY
jgi:hypothetical protein